MPSVLAFVALYWERMIKPVWGRFLPLLLTLALFTTIVPLPQAALASSGFWTTTAQALPNGGSLTMVAGEKKTVTLSFTNTSPYVWNNKGARYISLYTQGPKYRKSVFQAPTWKSESEVAVLTQLTVAKGATGTVTFDLVAPTKSGTYKETFGLAADDTAWVSGGQVTLTITVTAKGAAVAPPAQPVSVAPTGVIVAKSASKLKMQAGQEAMIAVALKNSGVKPWSKVSLSLPTSIVAVQPSFRHLSWAGNDLAAAAGAFKKDAVIEMSFIIKAPDVNGTHNLVVTPRADGNIIAGAEFSIPVEVTGGSEEIVTAPLTDEGEVAETVELIEEPMMRVGVLIVDEETNDEVVIGSDESEVDVMTVSGATLATIPVGGKLRAAYEGGKYVAGVEKTNEPIRFVPKVPNAVLTIRNFDRRVTRGTSFANNTFRNILELRYNAKNDRAWLINEIPMELYLRGSAEVSDGSPVELQKTIMTAARTYAYYHWARASKHADEGFHVDAYRDQVYWGYDQEARTPRLTAAIEATRGTIVTYNGEAAITPYFSRSDGRTRNWSEVWAGSGYAWIKSVPVPCDMGKTLWGHGIGMSASGATCMAKDGQTFDQILKYFYQGIELNKKWN